jgi:Flp pilus assembly protein TadG
MKDRGAVSVELALAMPVLLAAVSVALWAVGAAGEQLACTDAARAGARAAARGESAEAMQALVRSVAPPGATIDTTSAAGYVTVRVAARTRPNLLGWRGPVVHGLAVARPEAYVWAGRR